MNRLTVRVERAMRSEADVPAEHSHVTVIDLASFGRGDPGVLAAASLDRDVFPRLVATMEAHPPASSHDSESDTTAVTSSDVPSGAAAREDQEGTKNRRTAGSVTTKNLLREWQAGLWNDDLLACRTVYAALVDVVDPAELVPLEVQLTRLADRREQALREAFSQCATRRDYAGMLEVGEQICRLLPDRPVAADFRRIRPHLEDRSVQETTSAESPTLRVVR